MEDVRKQIWNYLEGELNDNERLELEQWRGESKPNQEIWNEVESVWTNTETGESAKEAISRKKNTRTWKVIALSVLFFACFWLFVKGFEWFAVKYAPNESVKVEQTSAKETKELKLSDGSLIWLNENSSISYDSEFGKENKKLNLQGEAFIEAAADVSNPLVVITKDSRTSVSGSKVNIRAYAFDKAVELYVENGRAQFSSTKKDAKRIGVKAKEEALLEKGSENVKKKATRNLNYDSWRTDKLRFDNAPFPELITALERYYGIIIEVTNRDVLNCFYTGVYKNAKLSAVLRGITNEVNFQYSEKADRIEFLGKGCPK